MFNGGAISLTCYYGMTITKHFRFYNFGAQLFLAAMLAARTAVVFMMTRLGPLAKNLKFLIKQFTYFCPTY